MEDCSSRTKEQICEMLVEESGNPGTEEKYVADNFRRVAEDIIKPVAVKSVKSLVEDVKSITKNTPSETDDITLEAQTENIKLEPVTENTKPLLVEETVSQVTKLYTENALSTTEDIKSLDEDSGVGLNNTEPDAKDIRTGVKEIDSVENDNIENAANDRGRFVCHICDKKFVQKQYVERHIKLLHYKFSDFACNLCDKTFGVKATLDSHIILIHTSIRPFQCPNITCHYRTLQKQYFTKHYGKCTHKNADVEKQNQIDILADREINERGKDITGCHLCESVFPNIVLLINHLKCHTADGGLIEPPPLPPEKEPPVKISTPPPPPKRAYTKRVKCDAEKKTEKKIKIVKKRKIVGPKSFKMLYYENSGIQDAVLNDLKVEATLQDKEVCPSLDPPCDADVINESNDVMDNNTQAEEVNILSDLNISPVDNRVPMRVALAKALEILDQQLAWEEDLSKYKCNLCSITCLNEMAFYKHIQRHR